MNLTKIIWGHILASLAFVAVYCGVNLVLPEVDVHRSFAIITASVFLFLSLVTTVAAAALKDHKNPYYFSWITLFSVLVKLGVGLAVILWYSKYKNPQDKSYVIIFIIAYVIFTIFEVWLLQVLVKSAKKAWNK